MSCPMHTSCLSDGAANLPAHARAHSVLRFSLGLIEACKTEGSISTLPVLYDARAIEERRLFCYLGPSPARHLDRESSTTWTARVSTCTKDSGTQLNLARIHTTHKFRRHFMCFNTNLKTRRTAGLEATDMCSKLDCIHLIKLACPQSCKATLFPHITMTSMLSAYDRSPNEVSRQPTQNLVRVARSIFVAIERCPATSGPENL
jgi:hypothetical protein